MIIINTNLTKYPEDLILERTKRRITKNYQLLRGRNPNIGLNLLKEMLWQYWVLNNIKDIKKAKNEDKYNRYITLINYCDGRPRTYQKICEDIIYIETGAKW